MPAELAVRNAGPGALSAAELCRQGRLKQRLFDVPGYAEAVALFSDAREAEPESASALASLRHGPRMDADDRRAEAEAAVRLNPYDAQSCYELWRAADCGPDSPVIYRALALDPGFLPAHNDLAVALHQAGRTHEAGFHLRKGLKINPANTVARYNLILLLASRGRKSQARTLFESWAGSPDLESLVLQGNVLQGDPNVSGGILL